MGGEGRNLFEATHDYRNSLKIIYGIVMYCSVRYAHGIAMVYLYIQQIMYIFSFIPLSLSPQTFTSLMWGKATDLDFVYRCWSHIVRLKNRSHLQWAQTPIRVNKHTHTHTPRCAFDYTSHWAAPCMSAALLPKWPIAVNHRADTSNFRS